MRSFCCTSNEKRHSPRGKNVTAACTYVPYGGILSCLLAGHPMWPCRERTCLEAWCGWRLGDRVNSLRLHTLCRKVAESGQLRMRNKLWPVHEINEAKREIKQKSEGRARGPSTRLTVSTAPTFRLDFKPCGSLCSATTV